MNQNNDYDFETTEQAKSAIGSMYDLNTREGQRQYENSMLWARIQERDK